MSEQEEKTVVEYKSHDGQELKLGFQTVRKYLISGKSEFVTDQEIMFFLGVCKSRGLNPFKRDCYLVKYTEKDNAAIITSLDYYRARSKAQPDCQGWQCGIVVRNGKGIEYRQGSLITKDETLLGGWFEAQPKGWLQAHRHTVSLAPFIKRTSDGRLTRFWADEQQPYMIAKVAEAQGLRQLWPDEFQQLHVEEEIIKETDITPAAEVIAPTQAGASREEPKEIPEQREGIDYKAKLESAIKEVSQNSTQFKDTLRRLTAKNFMTSLNQEEARAAFEQFLEEQKGAA